MSSHEKNQPAIIIGILEGFKKFSSHHYKNACNDLGLGYEIIDFVSPDWIKNIEKSKADLFVAQPEGPVSVEKQMYDERLYFLVHSMGEKIYPSFEELFIYKNKRNMVYWLEIHKIPHPKTKVIYLRNRELNDVVPWLEELQYPIIYKTNTGSAAAHLINSKRQLNRLLKKISRSGFVRTPADKLDVQRGYAIFQQHIPDAKQWRIIKIGESYFGHQKLKAGRFHSGSDRIGWYDPPKSILQLCKDVCDRGNFTSMALDILEDALGNYYVIGLQTIFGSYNPSQMYIDGKPGRYLYDELNNEWIFEEGYFNKHYSHKLRLEYAINQILIERKNKHMTIQ
ncbi:MAG: hypothetical protein SCK70_06090 [bacterium]|nr:hypothetical protein [bacterium]